MSGRRTGRGINSFQERSDLDGRHVAHPSLFPLIDIGSDPAAQRIVAARADLEEPVRARIVDLNGRELFDIDRGFTPSGPSILGADN